MPALRNLAQVAEGPIKKQQVDKTQAAQVSSWDTAHADSVYSNLDWASVDGFLSFLTGPLIN